MHSLNINVKLIENKTAHAVFEDIWKKVPCLWKVP